MSRLTVNGVELHYEEEGSGPAVVFVHGVWMSSRFFAAQREYFRERYRTIALDLRGHGASEQVPEGHTVSQYARDLHAFLEALAVDDAVLVGWSMGSFVVWDLIEQFGLEGIRGMVDVDQSPSDFAWPDWPYGPFGLDDLRDAMVALQEDRRAFAEEFVGLMFKSPPSSETAAWVLEEMLRPTPVIAAAILFDQTMRDYRETLAEVTVPTLVCEGGGDSFLSDEAAAFMLDRLPSAELVVFEKSGHCPFLEEADRFNRVVAGFVESLV